MDNKDIELIQRTFGKVALIKEQAAAQFYDRLFVLDPKLRPMFKGDMKAQGEKLMMTIATAVRNLKSPDAIRPSVVGLGQRHKGYGVKDADYNTVADALLWTLEKNLGPEFTPEVKQAWVRMYTLVAGMMKAA